MYRPRTERSARLLGIAAGAFGLALWLGGCSDLYWDRREGVSLSANDAVAANSITQMVDPWPPNSGNKTIPYNGQKMQVAVERYRTGTVIPPVSAVTSDAAVPPATPPLPPPSASSQATPSAISATTTTATSQ